MLTAMIGLMAGFIHVLAGPDHLAAVAPLAVQKKQKTWRLGFQWGVGHTGGVLIVGFAAILFRDILPIDSLSEYSERLVGVTLVAIGIWALHKAFKTRIHVHPP